MLELLINANITKFHVQICRTTLERLWVHSAPLPPTIQVLVSKMSKHIQLLSAAGATFVFIKSSPTKLQKCRFHITHFLPGAWVYDFFSFMQAAVQHTDRITPIFGVARAKRSPKSWPECLGCQTQNPKQMNWWALSKLHFDSKRRGPLQTLRKNTLNFKISRICVNKEGCELIEQSFWNIVKQGLPNTSKHCQLFLISSLAWQGYSQQTSGSIHEDQQWNVK